MYGTRSLVLVSGPVASGKTTLVQRVATLVRSQDAPAASLDMDEFVEMIAGRDWTRVTSTHRRQACVLAATLIDKMLVRDPMLVAVAGTTVSPYESDEVVRHLQVPVDPIYVRLRVSIDEAIRRAQDDPTRVLTRDPAVVARLHNEIDWDTAREPDLEIDTDALTVEEIAETVLKRVRQIDNDRRISRPPSREM